MTAQQLDHCEHECVCCDYGIVTREDGEPCTIINCINRSRPHTPAPALFQIEPNSHDYTIGQIVEINENIQKQRKEAARTATLAENKRVLDRLDKEIATRENEMNRKGNLEDNLTSATGYLVSAGALNWVRVVLIDGLRQSTAAQEVRR
jgi:hypothetical protein